MSNRVTDPGRQGRQNTYLRYMQADFNWPDNYPITAQLDAERYRPLATWMGRLILPTPEQRAMVLGTLFEVYHADADHQHLVGQVVRLRWMNDAETNQRFWSVTRQVIFDKDSQQRAAQGIVLPERINHWPLVNPFESLAGAHPYDDVVVRLQGSVYVVEAEHQGEVPIVYTNREPAQISGRYYALVRFIAPVHPGSDEVRIVHYNRSTGTFDGPTEVVRLPQVMADQNGVVPSTSTGIEHSPANMDGWYIHGMPDKTGTFVVQSLAPRGLLRLQPGQVVVGQRAGMRYLQPRHWQGTAIKGTFSSTLLCPEGFDPQSASVGWQIGDMALVVHLYGIIGGPGGEPARRSPVQWGHFSFGVAQVIHEPLADELIFDIDYQQVYVHSGHGLIAGTHHWSRYTGDRQFGWLGTRPIQDLLIKLDCFTSDFVNSELQRSALTETIFQLEAMTARYRIADGRGGTQISASNNCAQDSCQALYAAIKHIDLTLHERDDIQEWMLRDPQQAQRLHRLLHLGRDLKHKMLPLGAARADWDWGMITLGSSLVESPLRSLGMALRTWRTMLPSVAVRCIAEVFLHHGATAWVLRTNQVGGYDPRLKPIVPNV